MNMSPSVQDHLQRLLKTAAVVILAGLIFALCSCGSTGSNTRTTTVAPDGTKTITEPLGDPIDAAIGECIRNIAAKKK